MMRGHGSWVLCAVAFLVGGAVACSSGQASSSAGGTASIAPGHATPEEAVAGFVHADFSGNTAAACSYFEPAVQAACRGAQITAPTGHLSIVGVVTSGNQALVEVTGQVCQSGNPCQANTDASTGMPTGSLSFTQAYNKVLTGIANGGGVSPVPCIEVNGKWYVYEPTG
jgi:hypothetical protein